MPSFATVPGGLTAGGRHALWDPARVRYVALDVDGTLLREATVPSARILAAVERLVTLGCNVGVATGRTDGATSDLLATGAFTGPHVFHNGAVVVDAEVDGRVVIGLSRSEVDAILEFGRGRDDLSVEVYVADGYLTDRDDPRSAAHARLLGVAPSGSIRSSEDLGASEAVKAVLVCFDATAADEAVAAMAALRLAAGPAGSPATPQLRYVNVTRAGVDKGSGVATAAERLGVDLAEVLVIGDEINDMPALALAGTAIAMGDAAPTVKAVAHLVAPPFAEHGAAVALEAIADLLPYAPTQRAPGTW